MKGRVSERDRKEKVEIAGRVGWLVAREGGWIERKKQKGREEAVEWTGKYSLLVHIVQ